MAVPRDTPPGRDFRSMTAEALQNDLGRNPATPAASSSSSSSAPTLKVVTALYAMQRTDTLLVADSASGFTITLPPARVSTGVAYRVCNVGDAPISLAAASGDIIKTVGGEVTSLSLASGATVEVQGVVRAGGAAVFIEVI